MHLLCQTSIRLKKSGLTLPNPVVLAAGFDKNAEVFGRMGQLGFGFIECGTVTPRPQAGNPKPRVFRLKKDQAVINRLGFNNYGLPYFRRRLARRSGTALFKIGANIGANKDSQDTIADYVKGIETLLPLADYLTINISSPNTPGLRDLQHKQALAALLDRCQDAYRSSLASSDKASTPVFLKLAPDLLPADLEDITATLLDSGQWLAGLIISNTTLTRPDQLTDPLRHEMGGLSGRPLMMRSTEVLRYFAQALENKFDLIGCGGVSSGAEAYAKIRAGASAVQLYTALLYQGAGLVQQINQDLQTCLQRDGFSSVAEAIGADLS